MPKYGEMVSVCQENINHFCICRKIVFEPRSLDLQGLVDYIFVTYCYRALILYEPEAFISKVEITSWKSYNLLKIKMVFRFIFLTRTWNNGMTE